jgi:hypothetical protein
MAAKIFSLVPHNLSFFLLATISLVPKPEIKNGKKPKGGIPLSMFRGWHFPEGVTDSRENASPCVKIFDHCLKIIFYLPFHTTV